METLKNFLTGLSITILAFLILSLGILLWPFLLGIGSIFFFIVAVILAILLGFYFIVLIGYVVRKGFKKES